MKRYIPRSKIRLAIVVSVVLLPLTACTKRAQDPASATRPPPAVMTDANGKPRITGVDVVRIASDHDLDVPRTLPLDPYSMSSDQQNAIERARYALIVRCMQSQGFTMPAYQPPPSASVSPRNELGNAIGAIGLSDAEKHGYDSPVTGPEKTADQSRSTASEDYNDPSFQRALNGPPQERPKPSSVDVGGGFRSSNTSTYTPSSCTGQSYSKLGIGSSLLGEIDSDSLVVKLRNNAHREALNAPHVAVVNHAWSECMAGYGFRTSDPIAASNTYGPKGGQESIAAATADVRCAYKTNYYGVMFTLVVKYQDKAVQDNITALKALLQRQQAAIAESNRVIQGR